MSTEGKVAGVRVRAGVWVRVRVEEGGREEHPGASRGGSMLHVSMGDEAKGAAQSQLCRWVMRRKGLLSPS